VVSWVKLKQKLIKDNFNLNPFMIVFFESMIFYEILYRRVPWKADNPLDLFIAMTSK